MRTSFKYGILFSFWIGKKESSNKERAKREKKECLDWAKSQGWHRDNSTDFRGADDAENDISCTLQLLNIYV